MENYTYTVCIISKSMFFPRPAIFSYTDKKRADDKVKELNKAAKDENKEHTYVVCKTRLISDT